MLHQELYCQVTTTCCCLLQWCFLVSKGIVTCHNVAILFQQKPFLTSVIDDGNVVFVPLNLRPFSSILSLSLVSPPLERFRVHLSLPGGPRPTNEPMPGGPRPTNQSDRSGRFFLTSLQYICIPHCDFAIKISTDPT